VEFPVNETACVRCGLGVGEKHSAAWLCVDREGIIPGSPGGSLPKIGEKKTFSRVPLGAGKGAGNHLNLRERKAIPNTFAGAAAPSGKIALS